MNIIFNFVKTLIMLILLTNPDLSSDSDFIKMKISSFKILFLILSLSFVSCHHNADLTIEPPKPAPPGPEFKCSHDTIYFRNSVYPVVLSECGKSGCHDQTSSKGDKVLDNYTDIYRLIIPFDPQSSKLYKVLFSNSQGRMPPNSPLSTEQKSIIYWWIKQGVTIINVILPVVIQPLSHILYPSSRFCRPGV